MEQWLYRDSVDSDKALAVILHKGLEAHGLEAIPQHVVHVLMALPQLFQPLLGGNGQSLPHSIPAIFAIAHLPLHVCHYVFAIT